MGRRCTYCGGLMAGVDELNGQQQAAAPNQQAVVQSTNASPLITSRRAEPVGAQMPVQNGVPTLTLYNPTLDIRMVGVNGAIIGRRQGPYQQLFEGNMYISGVHAQLIYKPDAGWCIIDKHSSNGTKLNQRDLLPDVPMSIKAGDIVTLANINLQVSIS
jgi:pSer/pThr/pTyr-binding forkhead associated (FHA) protein